MTTTYSATSNDNRLAGAFEITKAFFNTTTQDDYVNIFLFDHVTVEALSNRAVSTLNHLFQTLLLPFVGSQTKGWRSILSTQATSTMKNVIFIIWAKFIWNGTFGEIQV